MLAAADVRRLLDAAHHAGEDQHWLDRVARELLELVLLEKRIDRRVIAAIATAQHVIDLADQGVKPMQIAKRTGIPKSSVYRYLQKKRSPRIVYRRRSAPTPLLCHWQKAIPMRVRQSIGRIGLGGHFPGGSMSKLKDTMMKTGSGTPKPASAYQTDHGAAKANNAGKTEVPRDGGNLSDGTTGGNFKIGGPAGMTSIPNNSGQGASIVGAEEAKAAFESNSK